MRPSQIRRDENERNDLPEDLVNHDLARVFAVENFFGAIAGPNAERRGNQAGDDQDVLQRQRVGAKDRDQDVCYQQPDDRSASAGSEWDEARAETSGDEDRNEIGGALDPEGFAAFGIERVVLTHRDGVRLRDGAAWRIAKPSSKRSSSTSSSLLVQLPLQ